MQACTTTTTMLYAAHGNSTHAAASSQALLGQYSHAVQAVLRPQIDCPMLFPQDGIMQPQHPAPAAVVIKQKTHTVALAPVVTCCSDITATSNTANMCISCRSTLPDAEPAQAHAVTSTCHDATGLSPVTYAPSCSQT
jgi:hypothetical protein